MAAVTSLTDVTRIATERTGEESWVRRCWNDRNVGGKVRGEHGRYDSRRVKRRVRRLGTERELEDLALRCRDNRARHDGCRRDRELWLRRKERVQGIDWWQRTCYRTRHKLVFGLADGRDGARDGAVACAKTVKKWDQMRLVYCLDLDDRFRGRDDLRQRGSWIQEAQQGKLLDLLGCHGRGRCRRLLCRWLLSCSQLFCLSQSF